MYTPLYIKTENSLLQSLIKIDDLIEFAKERGIKSLTITDNKMYGAYYFYKKCKSNGINPIIGLEVFLGDYRIVLYCKNFNGYKNLLKISSLESISFDDLKMYCSDLICIVPYDSFVLYDRLCSIFSCIFIGYKSSNEMKQLKHDNLVYFNEILCFEKSDLEYLKYLRAIRDGVSVSDVVDFSDNYFRLSDEVLKFYPDFIDNNYRIGEMCKLEIVLQKDLLPKYPCPENDSYGYLKKLCISGLKRLFGDTVSRKYVDRLKYELDVINSMGFCNYFLVVWDYVKFSKENGILVGPGRGSAAGSLVSYLLDITTIDPIKYDLLFERFLNPERVTMPDIDIDFEFNRRQEVVDYCISKYGEKRVAPIITFGTLGAKQSIRDVSRCLNVPVKTIDRLCSLIDSRYDLRKNYNDNVKIRNFLDTDKFLKKVYNVSVRLEGLKRHTSIHAAGIVMSCIDLDCVIPLDKSHDFYTTGYSMEFLEELGLLKMDFLALKNLTLVNDVLKEIGLSFDSIPNNDFDTIRLFSEGNTLGIFQFESSGMISFLNKFKPSCFEDIIACIALYRPGPMSNIDTYIKRKNGIVPISYIVPELEPILKSTYGIIVYQEQIMQIARVMAGYSFGEADVLRRAMSKKKEEILLKEKDRFVERSVSLGFVYDKAVQVYDLILKFASYGFNRAHSVAYAMISYRIAYLKEHYPLVFMKWLLNSNVGDSKVSSYIYECKSRGIKLFLPDVNLSNMNFSILNDGLVFPLVGIKGVGTEYATKIISGRSDKPFLDVFDFIRRTGVNKGVFESLVFAGCFDSFSYNKKTLIMNIDKIINYGDLGELFDDKSFVPILDYYDEFDGKYLMEKEFEVLGLYVSNHPITQYKKKFNCIDLSLISSYFDKRINVVVYVDRIKLLDTKKGDKMCFITGSDESCSVDVVMFPRVYDDSISLHDILYLNCTVEKRFDKYQLVVNGINEIIK